MKVKLRNPDRIVDVSGPRVVSALLKELDIVPGTKIRCTSGS